METAITYVRVSDLRQVERGNSLTSQEKLVEAYVRTNNYAMRRSFIERAETAKTTNRPVLQEMLAFCRSHRGEINVLVIPKIDRLARDRDDYGALKVVFLRLGVRIESVGERLENTPAGRFMESVIASVAQFDNELRAERCKGGMIQAVREGRWVWKAPVGYKNTRVNGKGTIEPHPKTAPLIIWAFTRLAQGKSSEKAVWRSLREKGIKISFSLFNQMLHSKVYVGIIEPFGMHVKGTPPFVPLISEDIFYAAQTAGSRGRAVVRRYDHNNVDFPMRGVFRCECGRALHGAWAQGRSARYAYYRCPSCARLNIPRGTTDTSLLEEWRGYRPVKERLHELGDVIARRWLQRNQEMTRERMAIDDEIASILEIQQGLARKSAVDLIPEEVAQREFRDLEKKLGDLRSRRHKVVEVEAEVSEVLEVAARWLTELHEVWQAHSVLMKKRIANFFYPNGLVVQGNGSLRTIDYPLLETVKGVICNGESSLVDQAPEAQNRVFAWLTDLRKLVRELDESEGNSTEAKVSLDLPDSRLSTQGRSR